MGADGHLEAVWHLPLDAVPFLILLILNDVVGLGGLVSLTVLNQPISVGLPDQGLANHFRDRLNLPFTRSILWVLPRRGCCQAFVVIASSNGGSSSLGVIDVLTCNVDCRIGKSISRIVVGNTPIVDVDRIGWVGVVADVPIRPHKPTGTRNHLEPIFGDNESLSTRIGNHGWAVYPRLKHHINLSFSCLVPRKHKLLRGDVVLLDDQIAPKVKPLGNVTQVRNRSAIRANPCLVRLGSSVSPSLIHDGAKEEPVGAL